MKHTPFPELNGHPPPLFEPAQPPPPKRRWALSLFLFLGAVATTLLCGYEWHVQFTARSAEEAGKALDALLAHPALLLYGVPFSFTLLLILLAHEMGHYLTCRRHGVEATLPFVIPAPPVLPLPPPLGWLFGGALGAGVGFFEWSAVGLNPFGTFGAVIRIKSAFANRRQLFDVGIAGPLAGFAVIVPALALGIALSGDFVPLNPEGDVLVFGEPWIFKLAVQLFFSGSDSADIRLHPIGWAAWFGLLATSINLLPIGQLDGGHIVYALFGPRTHRIVSFATFFGLIALNLFSWPVPGYLLFAVILLLFGFRHPPTLDEYSRIGRGRLAVAVIGLIVFVLTFIPFPVQILENTVRI